MAKKVQLIFKLLLLIFLDHQLSCCDTQLPQQLVEGAVKARLEVIKLYREKKIFQPGYWGQTTWDALRVPLTREELSQSWNILKPCVAEPELRQRYYFIDEELVNIQRLSPLAALISVSCKETINRDLIKELLVYGDAPDNKVFEGVIGISDIETMKLFLGKIDLKTLNEALCISIKEEDLSIAELLLFYKAQVNYKYISRTSTMFTVPERKIVYYRTPIYDAIENIIMHYNSTPTGYFNENGESYYKASDYLLRQENISKSHKIICMLLLHGSDPTVLCENNKSVFDLIRECKEQQSNPSFKGPRTQETLDQTKKELDELVLLLKKPLIDRMTGFLHTRALKDKNGTSQTPFKIKEITKKIVEHLYKDDMKVSKQDWDKLLGLVKKPLNG